MLRKMKLTVPLNGLINRKIVLIPKIESLSWFPTQSFKLHVRISDSRLRLLCYNINCNSLTYVDRPISLFCDNATLDQTWWGCHKKWNIMDELMTSEQKLTEFKKIDSTRLPSIMQLCTLINISSTVWYCDLSIYFLSTTQFS